MRIESFTEGAALAIDQLRANKFRSGLTILGIVVGVATVRGADTVRRQPGSQILRPICQRCPAFSHARFVQRL